MGIGIAREAGNTTVASERSPARHYFDRTSRPSQCHRVGSRRARLAESAACGSPLARNGSGALVTQQSTSQPEQLPTYDAKALPAKKWVG